MSRRATRLEEVADALDAGLDAAAAVAAVGAELAEGTVTAALDAGPVPLDAPTRAAFEAAEAAGRLPSALRREAERERVRETRVRAFRSRLAYPLFLAVAALATGLLASLAIGGVTTMLPAILGLTVLALAALVGVWLVRRIRRDPGFDADRLPLVGPLVADVAAGAWLSTMELLTASGVALPRAHELATRTVPVAATRARLTRATTTVLGGERLAAALDEARAFDGDTIDAIARAEELGTLEQTFARLGKFRSDRADRRASALARGLGSAAYLLAVIVVAATVFAFYSGLYGRFLR